ncbi:hypothetical protein PAMP_020050 [Pampus punctatissimus]
MDGWTDKTETAAARQRTHIPCKTGCEGEQVWLRGTEKDPDKRIEEKNGGGGLWLSGLALGWTVGASFRHPAHGAWHHEPCTMHQFAKFLQTFQKLQVNRLLFFQMENLMA